MTTDLSQISKNLLFKDGVWETQTHSAVSYPSEDHSLIESFESESFWFQHRLEVLSSFLKKNKSAKILDIGGGGGLTSITLQKLGFNVVLLEPTIHGVMAARKKGVGNIVHGTLIEAGFTKGSFDCALLCDVLEHVENDKAFLDEIKHILAPGGELYITVPAFQFLWSQADTDAGHFRRYNSKSLAKVIKESGFQMQYLSCFFFPLVIPLLLFRTLPWVLGKRGPKADDSYATEHRGGNKIARLVLEFILNLEQWLMIRKIRIPMGTSCFSIVKKLK